MYMTKTNEYFPLKSYEGIYENNLGKNRNMDGIIMKFWESADKYLKVTLVKDGKELISIYIYQLPKKIG